MVLWLWMAQFSLAASIGIFGLPVAWLYLVVVMGGTSGRWRSADRPHAAIDAARSRREFYGLAAWWAGSPRSPDRPVECHDFTCWKNDGATGPSSARRCHPDCSRWWSPLRHPVVVVIGRDARLKISPRYVPSTSGARRCRCHWSHLSRAARAMFHARACGRAPRPQLPGSSSALWQPWPRISSSSFT